MSNREDFAVLLFVIVIAAPGLYQSAVKLAFGASFDVGQAVWASIVLIQGAPFRVRVERSLPAL